jgi:hypothetical protein
MQRSQPLSKFSEALGELAALPRSRTLTLPQGRDLLQELLAFRIGRVQASDRIGNLSTLVLEVVQSGMERVLLLVECPSLLVVPSESSSHGSDRLRFPGEGVIQPLGAAHQLHPLVIELHQLRLLGPQLVADRLQRTTRSLDRISCGEELPPGFLERRSESFLPGSERASLANQRQEPTLATTRSPTSDRAGRTSQLPLAGHDNPAGRKLG